MSINIFNYSSSGLYEIVCKKNGKRYIGESMNLFSRLEKHFCELQKGIGDCQELQQDWTKYTVSDFEAKILCMGPEWSTRKARLEKEEQILLTYTPAEVYNVHPNSPKIATNHYSVLCRIKGTVYPSIAAAAKGERESETRIRNKLQNNVPGYEVLGQMSNRFKPIMVDDRFYPSIQAAVEAGEAKDRFAAYRKLNSPRYPGWKRIPLENGQIETNDVN